MFFHTFSPFVLFVCTDLLIRLSGGHHWFREMRIAFLLLLILSSIPGCTSSLTGGRQAAPVRPTVPVSYASESFPQPAREFRGVWVASVANIDWPSEQGLSTEQQKQELREILDYLVQLNMNAVIFQVRPAADAMYESDLEPWSEYLTGVMGKAPYPYYDPLAFAVEEAHKRGLELHAWFNPFRARHKTGNETLARGHVSVRHPELVVKYGEQLWLDPGNPEAQFHTLSVIRDVVKRYDIDGIHIDDYFYPYPEKDQRGRRITFPDENSWAKARDEGAFRSRDDWRRDNINRFIERLYATVKQEKPWVKVGISPFGIWRPGHPEEVRGMDAYSNLYANSRLWLQNGWVDYMSPQLYWSIGSARQSFPQLYKWWNLQNVHKRHVWPGTAIYRVDYHGWSENEILDQIRITRSGSSNPGNVLFSMRILANRSNRLGYRLVRDVYNEPALVPEMPWLHTPRPGTPSIIVDTSTQRAILNIDVENSEHVRRWVVRARYGGSWKLAIVPGSTSIYQLPLHVGRAPINEVTVSAVDRLGQESRATRIHVAESGALRMGF